MRTAQDVYLSTFPRDFRKSFHIQNQFKGFGEDNISTVKRFGRMKNWNVNDCIFKIKFIHVFNMLKPVEIAVRVNLAEKDWYTNLLKAIGVSSIITRDGIIIKYFDRDQIAKYGASFFAYTTFDKSTLKLPIKYQPDTTKQTDKYWEKLVSGLRTWTVDTLVEKINKKEYSDYINNGRYLKDAFLHIKAFVGDESNVKEFGFTSFDKFVLGLSFDNKLINKEDFIDYTYNVICIPVEQLLYSSNQELKQFILQNSTGDASPSIGDIKLFVDRIISPVFDHIQTTFDMSKVKRLKEPRFYTKRVSMPMEKMNAQSPITKDLDLVSIPYYYQDARVNIANDRPLTPYSQKFDHHHKALTKQLNLAEVRRIKDEKFKHRIYVVGYDGQTYALNWKDDIINEVDCDDSGLFLYGSKNYKSFDPLASVLIDHEDRRTPFQESYIPEENVHLFIINKD